MKNYFITLLFIIFSLSQVLSQTTDTIHVHSAAMHKDIPNLIILPASYTQTPAKRYPVVYLLHGFGGNYTTWAYKTKPDLDKIASSLDFILVCPDGADSWYWDSPRDSSYRYETYISQELIEYIDRNYRSIPSRSGRAITGFSMGGHGGLWLGFRHPDLFYACGSMSGGVDIRPFPNNWNMKKTLGDYATHPQQWEQHTVINQLPFRLDAGPLAIILDCGTEDFFSKVNQALHEKLLYYNIPHDYIVRPGGHTASYWNNAIDYQLLFFKKALQRLL